MAVYMTKEQYKKPHLSTPHAMIGCAAVSYIVIQSCAGMNLLFPDFVRKFIDPRQLGRIHGLSGTFLLLLATLTLLGGINTDWFRERVAGYPWYASLVVPLIIYAAVVKQVVFKGKDARKPKKQS